MSSLQSSHLPIIHAYRHLYRNLLHAVQFAKPARYIARDRLRKAFRTGQSDDFNQQRIANTLEFLQGATREIGLEHKILKNLLHTSWSKAELLKRPSIIKPSPLVQEMRDTAPIHYEMTIAMLNDSMGLCLPVS